MLPASLSARWLPREFVETSRIGGAMTLVAYVLMLTLFTCELRSFLTSSLSSALKLDHEDAPQLQINFDIDMHSIECRSLEVVAIDEFRNAPIRLLEKHYELNTIDRGGRLVRNHAFRAGADADEDEEAAHRRLAERLKREDGQQELDADWADSHDGFKHQSFEHVIQFHDFTLINFFADWCIHCQMFSPMWKEIAEQVKGLQVIDRAGKTREVMPIKMNCVDFQQHCKAAGITGFPTIRLYKSNGSFSRFEGQRSIEGILKWVQGITASTGSTMASHHEELATGCNAKGFLRVPRVPGHLELMAGKGDQDLEPTMANVSHLVKHLSFSDPRHGIWTQKTWPSLPLDALVHVAPIDGRQYCTEAFHEAYEHHLQVVSTVTPLGVGYQFSHYGRTARLNTSIVPQARFFYDLEPFSIEVRHEAKPWYSFGTSLLAILGGIFVLMRFITMASLAGVGALVHARAATHSGGRKGADGLLT